MRALRWRAAFTVVSAAFVIAYLWGSGRSGNTIQIDYSWAGAFLDSAEVYIDGEVVGYLTPYGRNQRQTGFRVEAGEHKVRVTHPDCEGGREYDVKVGGDAGRLAVRMADIEDGYNCRVILR